MKEKIEIKDFEVLNKEVVKVNFCDEINIYYTAEITEERIVLKNRSDWNKIIAIYDRKGNVVTGYNIHTHNADGYDPIVDTCDGCIRGSYKSSEDSKLSINIKKIEQFVGKIGSFIDGLESKL